MIKRIKQILFILAITLTGGAILMYGGNGDTSFQDIDNITPFR